MRHQLRNPHFYIMVLSDVLIFGLAYWGAFLLRFEFALKSAEIDQLITTLPRVVVVKLAVFFAFGLYRGMWRYSGVEDFWKLAQTSLISMLLNVTLMLYLQGFGGFSRAVFLLDAVLTFLMTGGLRMAIRSYLSSKGFPFALKPFRLSFFKNVDKNLKRVLIIGAGGSGEKLLREIFDNPGLDYEVIGFLDDDPGKRGRAIHDIKVLGAVDALPYLMQRKNIDQVFISVPSATGNQMRRIVEICKACNAPYKTLPAIGQIMNGNVSVKALRDVNYEDLLRRQPVKLDMAGISEYLSERTVMVTGAGGSIGSELCRQVIQFNPKKLLLVDASEENLYRIQMEMRYEIKFSECVGILGRIQEKQLMEDFFHRYQPEVVFHAAAYKHVPMIEMNPWEAVFNNVIGSKILMDMAVESGVERFVLVSTDKAVRPTNVMGTSKRLAEIILQSYRGNAVKLMAVRFGNVVGSSGSVIPLFRRQIAIGGPVTVTHPEVTRYFMTIPEASQLILQAGAIGEGGEIFILEMGTPVKIVDMARDLIRLSGKKPDTEIEIEYVGLREGEKLYEELITQGEGIVATPHEKIMVLKSNGYLAERAELRGDRSDAAVRQWLDGELEELCSLAKKHDPCAIRVKLKHLVPEYTPQESECVL